MGRQPGGLDAHRANMCKRLGRSQHLEFGVDGQAIARLDFHGAHAFGQESVEARQALGDEFLYGCIAGCAHGRYDAATSSRDLCIGGTLKAHLEFDGAIAAVDEMGVTVDERRGNEAATTVDDRRAFRSCQLAPDGSDSAARDKNLALNGCRDGVFATENLCVRP
jgi:hypothetical protein